MEGFYSIGADVVPESVKRFGKVYPDKPRLLMVKMPTMKDKGQTLKSAWKLNNSNATKKTCTSADPEDWKIDYRRWQVVHKPPQPTPNQ